MSSEATIRDRAIRDHQAWLGYLQPDGLVVSPAALVDAQVVLDTRAIDTQAKFEPFVADIDDDKNDRQHKVIKDFPAFCCGFLEWPDDLLYGTDAACPIPESLIIPLAELGETLEPTYALKDPKPKEAKPGDSHQPQPWLLLIKVLDQTDGQPTDLDVVTTGDSASWSASATRRFERLLRETRVPIGLLVNGTHIRLVYAPRGENSGSLTFPVAAMTEVAGRPILAALHELLSRYRLLAAPSEARLQALLTRSRDYQSTVSTELAQQVIDAAFDLLRGFQAADERTKGVLLKDVLATAPNKVYEGLLTVLMRSVFLLFAEDRGLMPGGSLYQQNYALHGLFERLRADHERYPDTMDSRYGAWAQLLALFRAVYNGCSHPSMKLPARAGYLFDPERFPFLEGRPTASSPPGRLPLVPDGTIFRCLRRLLILKGERLSYRTLDVEQIGSVYEVMMGFGVGIAAGPSIAIKPKKTHGAPVPIDLDELLKQPGAERGKWLKAATDQELSDKPGVALKAAKTVDDLLAALEQGKKIARSATPAPVPTGAMLLVPSDERRRSGSNYTPRSLTEPIVRKTLEPILKRLGDDVKPDQILDLKVCDPAMGSGAFLVEACRQLAEVLVKAWHRHKQLPTIPPDEDELLYAKRLIAQRCLYGVDKNPMAADLAKLSMWLATLARDHPFTFLDHSFRAGDSLVGLTKVQIASFTWEPGGGVQKSLWAQLIEPRIDAALAARREILVAGDFMNPETKRQKLAVADEQLGVVRFIGDLAVAAFFAEEKDKPRKERRAEYLQQLTAYLGDRSKLGSGGAAGDISKRPQKPVDALRAGEKGITPFHWEIEFPEVFGRETRGFDLFVGNPPFAGHVTLSTSTHPVYTEYLRSTFDEIEGKCDLIAFFFQQTFRLLRREGCFGLVATTTVRQGDTRSSGLRVICNAGAQIFEATSRLKWPGEASVSVCVVHACKGAWSFGRILDGRPVDLITAYLFHAGGNDNPAKLHASRGRSFQGTVIRGTGFLFDDSKSEATPVAEAERLLAAAKRNSQIIRPFLGGDDLVSSPRCSTGRYVIDFGDLSEEEARKWPALFAIAEDKVKPARQGSTAKTSVGKVLDDWWKFSHRAAAMYGAIGHFDRVLACPQTSSYLVFAYVPTGVVLAQTLVVTALASTGAFCLLQSRLHEVWAVFNCSTLEERFRYMPTDAFETFPFPEDVEIDLRLEAAGQAYYEFRATLMVRNNEGLTKTYNRFHDPEEASSDILKLRDLHAAMDRAALDAYGWKDIPTACEFLLDYEEADEDGAAADGGKGRKKRKPYRYRWPDVVRDEVLAKLLALNAERAEAERLTGAAASAKPAKAKRPKTKEVDGLFAASDASDALQPVPLLQAVEIMVAILDALHPAKVQQLAAERMLILALNPAARELYEQATSGSPVAKATPGNMFKVLWQTIATTGYATISSAGMVTRSSTPIALTDAAYAHLAADAVRLFKEGEAQKRAWPTEVDNVQYVVP